MADVRPEVALPTSWKNQPLPTRVATLPFRHGYTAEEFAALTRGLIPEEMEDKWFVFMQDGVLNFHRSWTGVCIYRVVLHEENGVYIVHEVLVNRDPEQYKSTDDAYDSALLNFLIDALLLCKRTPFPVPGDVPTEAPAGLYQHHMVGRGCGLNVDIDAKMTEYIRARPKDFVFEGEIERVIRK